MHAPSNVHVGPFHLLSVNVLLEEEACSDGTSVAVASIFHISDVALHDVPVGILQGQTPCLLACKSVNHTQYIHGERE